MSRSVRYSPRLSRRAFLGAAAGACGAWVMPPAVPAATNAGEVVLYALGDWGDGKGGQRAVADAMVRRAATEPPDLVLSLGDNFYPKGVATATDRLWDERFRSVYGDAALETPWFAVLGNHDHRGNVSAEVAHSGIDPKWHMPQRYFNHVQPVGGQTDLELFFLDTTTLAADEDMLSAELADPEQLQWLEGALAKSTARWRIVAGHHPVFSGGRHGNTPVLVRYLKPLLERHGVQAYLNGHDHDLQHVLLGNVHYLTSGAGSETRSTGRVEGTVFALSELGFLELRVGAQAISGTFLTASGEALHTFDIEG